MPVAGRGAARSGDDANMCRQVREEGLDAFHPHRIIFKNRCDDSRTIPPARAGFGLDLSDLFP